MKKYKIELTVFLCGAISMMLELVAARVLSPYVGSSNLIWTTIIGVMLISMSIGYSIGGKIADKKTDMNILSFLILLGAFFTSLIPIFETALVKTMSQASDNLVFIAIVTSASVSYTHLDVYKRQGADRAIVVTTAEISAIRDADRIIGLLESSEIKNPELVINRIRPNMVKKGEKMCIRDSGGGAMETVLLQIIFLLFCGLVGVTIIAVALIITLVIILSK